METLIKYPKVTVDFVRNTINSMFDKEIMKQRYKWIKKKHKFLK